MRLLANCRYCGEKLAAGGSSLSCDECEGGFHVACADRADDLDIAVNSRLLRSDTYEITCPECGNVWSVSFDPRE
jgi:exosome complex RNA-binding protein Csl4